MPPAPPSAQRNLLSACAAAAAIMAAFLLGQSAALSSLAWYSELIKPPFTPPRWVLGPVWIALFPLMGYALWRILRLPAAMPGRSRALAYFFIQLGLNAAWPWVFFVLQRPLWALFDIYPQLAFILLAAAAFLSLDATAGWCLVPLAAWVSFASALNLAIWRANG